MDDKEIGVELIITSRNIKQKKTGALSVHASKVHLPHVRKILHRLAIKK